ncbi:hypothetical protein BJ741DRAFT_650938 [Chytriomyces cf. hyalinus JEL632]|nr:hypothetical protein BJ741DRAFT_650938 [Chytriomyces cf. hyalinus JEL632]
MYALFALSNALCFMVLSLIAAAPIDRSGYSLNQRPTRFWERGGRIDWELIRDILLSLWMSLFSLILLKNMQHKKCAIDTHLGGFLEANNSLPHVFLVAMDGLVFPKGGDRKIKANFRNSVQMCFSVQGSATSEFPKVKRFQFALNHHAASSSTTRQREILLNVFSWTSKEDGVDWERFSLSIIHSIDRQTFSFACRGTKPYAKNASFQDFRVLNWEKWKDLNTYIAYMVNHEVGHLLGHHSHLKLGHSDSLYPVMFAQTKPVDQPKLFNAFPSY